MSSGHDGSDFPSSQWSLISRAGGTDRGEARRALTDLCQRYWYPIYAYVRRQVRGDHDAEDLTQAFFVHLLETDMMAVADRSRGRFRSFLLVCCRNFLANAQRASPPRSPETVSSTLTFDFSGAARRFAREPADLTDAEALFMRRWALTLLDETFQAVEAAYRHAGQAEVYRHLQPCLGSGADKLSYGPIAAALGMTEPAVRKAAQRLRERFGEELRHRVRQTVARPEDVTDEIRDLFAAVR